jgi:sec-independent protein translocase protein TatA
MNFFGIGLPEMVLIMAVALLIFGPKKLPEIGRSLGKAIRGFQDASKEFENEFKREAERLEQTVNQPMTATLETPSPQALSPAADADSTIVSETLPAEASPSIETSPSEATPTPSDPA